MIHKQLTPLLKQHVSSFNKGSCLLKLPISEHINKPKGGGRIFSFGVRLWDAKQKQTKGIKICATLWIFTHKSQHISCLHLSPRAGAPYTFYSCSHKGATSCEWVKDWCHWIFFFFFFPPAHSRRRRKFIIYLPAGAIRIFARRCFVGSSGWEWDNQDTTISGPSSVNYKLLSLEEKDGKAERDDNKLQINHELSFHQAAPDASVCRKLP